MGPRIASDGTGVLRVGVTGGALDDRSWAELGSSVAAVAPGLLLERAELIGPTVSTDLRAAVWAEAAVLATAVRLASGHRSVVDVPVEVTAPGGGFAVVRCADDGSLDIEVAAGPVLDAVVLRSYVIGAAHQALSWVGSEGIAVGPDGQVQDLTVRSFGILQSRGMPQVRVRLVDGPVDGTGPSSVNGSDAVFAAVAAARWLADGVPPTWPTDRSGAGRR